MLKEKENERRRNIDHWYGADLIAIGSHGRRGLNELVLGSVSNYVLHHVSCSVLLIHPELSSDLTQEAAKVSDHSNTI